MFPAYTAEQEQALSLLRVRSVFGNRIYSGSGAAPLLGIQGRATTGGEMAAAGDDSLRRAAYRRRRPRIKQGTVSVATE